MNTITILELFEEKKHSVRYNAIPAIDPNDAEPAVTSVYVLKTALGPRPYPRKIKLTLEATS